MNEEKVVQATKQQQIIGYFIEEAKEHLDTIEQGLLNLQATIADPEQINELFRAAHSIKGGAAMLGMGSIQQVSHHLEDCFKLLKDNAVQIDQPLEDLFLKVFDVLKGLIEALQTPYGLREDDATRMVQQAEPTFAELETDLQKRIQAGSSTSSTPVPVNETVSPAALAAQINGLLRAMLQCFKQRDSQQGRQQLVSLCHRLAQLPSCAEWQQLLQQVEAALDNDQVSYVVLAPVIIRELKQAGDLLIINRGKEILPSQSLQKLTTKPVPTQPSAGLAEKPPVQPALREKITIPPQPKAAAKVLLESFSKEEIIEIARYLMHAIQ